jgi:hypothetical protein
MDGNSIFFGAPCEREKSNESISRGPNAILELHRSEKFFQFRFRSSFFMSSVVLVSILTTEHTERVVTCVG